MMKGGGFAAARNAMMGLCEEYAECDAASYNPFIVSEKEILGGDTDD